MLAVLPLLALSAPAESVEGIYTYSSKVPMGGNETIRVNDTLLMLKEANDRYYFELDLMFENGHQCMVRGIAGREGDALVYHGTDRSECVLKMRFGKEKIAFEDDGKRCHSEYCGARGTIGDLEIFTRASRTPVENAAQIRQSEDYRTALANEQAWLEMKKSRAHIPAKTQAAQRKMKEIVAAADLPALKKALADGAVPTQEHLERAASAVYVTFEFLKLLLDHGVDSDITKVTRDRIGLVETVADTRKPELALKLLDHGIKPSDSKVLERIFLAAAYNGDVSLLKKLIARGVDINAGNGKLGLRALEEALRRNEDNSLYLISLLGPKNAASAETYAAAAGHGYTKALERLLESGFDVNTRTRKNTTPLLEAVSLSSVKNEDSIRLLLAKGADPHAVDGEGKGALLLSLEYHLSAERVKFVLEQPAWASTGPALAQAAFDRVIEIVSGPNHQFDDEEVVPILDLLRSKGAKAKDELLLTLTAGSGELATAEYLLNHGANPNGAMPSAPLAEALAQDHLSLAFLLLTRGAKPQSGGDPESKEARNLLAKFRLPEAKRDLTPERKRYAEARIHGYLFANDAKLVKEAMRLGAQPDAGMLCYAARQGNFAVLRVALENGFNPNAGTNHTLLGMVIGARGNVTVEEKRKMVNFLLEKGAKVDGHSGEMVESPLEAAARSGSEEFTRLLLEKGAKPSSRKSKFSNSPICEAMIGPKANPAVVELFVRRGESYRDCDKKSPPLVMAVGYRNLEMVKYLLARGEPTDKKDDEGRSALDLATEKGFQEIVQLLQSTPPRKSRPEASFDCGRAETTTEKAICASDSLRTADYNLGLSFSARLGAMSAKSQAKLKALQRGFLRRRDACVADEACILREYRTQEIELDNQK